MRSFARTTVFILASKLNCSLLPSAPQKYKKKNNKNKTDRDRHRERGRERKRKTERRIKRKIQKNKRVRRRGYSAVYRLVRWQRPVGFIPSGWIHFKYNGYWIIGIFSPWAKQSQMRDYCFITGLVDFSGLCFPCRRYSMKIGVTFEGIAQPRDDRGNIARNILIANRSLFFSIIKLVMLSTA